MTTPTTTSTVLRWAWFGVAVVAVALAGLLVGTGFDLGSLTGGDEEPDPLAGFEEIDWSTGVVVATDDGSGVDLVVASPGSASGGGPRCVGIRSDPNEPPTAIRCGVDRLVDRWEDPDGGITVLDDHFGFLDPVVVANDDGGWANLLAGAVSPQTVRVTAHLADGGEYSFVTRNEGGWFVVLVPDSIADPEVATGELVNGAVALDLYDVEGNRMTVIDLTQPPEAP